MLISDLIKTLQRAQAEHGDLEASIVNGEGRVECITYACPGDLKDVQDHYPETREYYPDCPVNHFFLKAN